MTLAASSSKFRRAAATAPVSAAGRRLGFSRWQALPVVLLALIGFLTLTPDGTAEPLQDFAGWAFVGGIATLAGMAIIVGLDRLLDCDGS